MNNRRENTRYQNRWDDQIGRDEREFGSEHRGSAQGRPAGYSDDDTGPRGQAEPSGRGGSGRDENDYYAQRRGGGFGQQGRGEHDYNQEEHTQSRYGGQHDFGHAAERDTGYNRERGYGIGYGSADNFPGGGYRDSEFNDYGQPRRDSYRGNEPDQRDFGWQGGGRSSQQNWGGGFRRPDSSESDHSQTGMSGAYPPGQQGNYGQGAQRQDWGDQGQWAGGEQNWRRQGQGSQSPQYGQQPDYIGQSSYGQGGLGRSDQHAMGMGGASTERHSGRAPKAYTRSDDRVQEDIYERLTHSDIDCTDIEVNVDKGEVTLTGTVQSRNCKFEAEHITDSVSGVKDVTNQLRIKRQNSGESKSGDRSFMESKPSPESESSKNEPHKSDKNDSNRSDKGQSQSTSGADSRH